MADNTLSCRGCLVKDKDFHSLERPEVKGLFVECTSIQILPEQSDLPQQICSQCYSQCEQWSLFKNMCNLVNQHLQEKRIVRPAKEVKVEEYDIEVDEVIPDEPDVNTSGTLAPCPNCQDDCPTDEEKHLPSPVADEDDNGMELVEEDYPLYEVEDDPDDDKESPISSTNSDIKCPVCKDWVPESVHLKNHLKEHYSEQDPQCPICSETFTRGSKVYPHIVAAHMGSRRKQSLVTRTDEPPKFQYCPGKDKGILGEYCPICNKHCSALAKHIMDAHVPKGSSVCPICSRQLGQKYILKQHLFMHTNEKPFKCSFCPELFLKRIQMRIHMRREHQGAKSVPGTYKCPLCQHIDDMANLRKHFVVHTTERPYQCTYCDRDYTQKNSVKVHIERMHADRTVEGGIRLKEGSIFQNLNPWEALGYSLDEITSEGSREEDEKIAGREVKERTNKHITCIQCNRKFMSPAACKTHMMTHKKRKTHRFACQECGNTFRQKALMIKHTRTHFEERPFSCDICDFTSKWKQNVSHHVAVVHKQ